MPLTICHTGMQQHFICMVTTQIQCAFKKYNVHTNKNVWECFFLFFIFIFQTQRQDIRLYADRQKSVGWVGKLSLLNRFLWQEKRKLDHMTGCDIWYSDLSPVPHSVYENFISCLFCKLSQQEKHLQSTQSKSNLQSLKYHAVSCSNHWVTSTPFTSLL